MDRRNFLKHTGWSLVGLAASGSLLSACQQGTAAGKKVMPSASNLKYFWGDLHNHCNITYGHGDMRSAFEAAKEQLDFVSVTPHAMWPDIPGADDPRLKWVIDYHTGAFKRLREGGYEKYVAMTNEYNKEGEFLAFVGYEAHSMEHGDPLKQNRNRFNEQITGYDKMGNILGSTARGLLSVVDDNVAIEGLRRAG